MAVKDRHKFAQELGETFENQMSSSNMLGSQIVTLLPLVNIELITHIEFVVIVLSLAHLEIIKYDASGQSSLILEFDVSLLKQTDNFLSVGIIE